MTIQNDHVAPRSIDSEQSYHNGSRVAALLRRIVPQLECGRLVIDFPNGEQLIVNGHRPGPHAQMTMRNWKCLWRMILSGEIGIADSYIAGDWSSSKLGTLMALAAQNSNVAAPLPWQHPSQIFQKLRHALNRNTKAGSRRNIAAHYDLGNEFYAHWLDASMSYSSGLFSTANDTLEEAQRAKLERVFELMEMRGGEHVLEIGCGWGGLAEQLVGHYRCDLTALTLSARQLEFARGRLRKLDLLQYGDLRLQDYRDVRGSYDRIVSIEMLEAVGSAYWPTYFRQLRNNLRPDGIAVLQVITIDEQRFDNYRRQPDFIQKYIFPGGMLPTTTIMEREISAAGLKLVATEHFGNSYARTLAEWHRRFQEAWPNIEPLGFDVQFKRLWEYYLTYCQTAFEAGAVNVGLYKMTHATNQ